MELDTLDPAFIFKGTSGPRDAQIMIVGESWGASEEREGKPFVGESGKLLTDLLTSLGIARDQCFCTNVVNERPPHNEMYRFFHLTREAKERGLHPTRGLYPRSNVQQGLLKLQRQIETVKPKLIIGFGNYALWALTDDSFKVGNTKGRKVPTGITSWRGSQLYTRDDLGAVPFLPTYHPAAVLRQWAWLPALQHDLRARVPKALRGAWAAPIYDFIVRPSFPEATSCLEQLLHVADNGETPLRLAHDLETRAGHIACSGIAWSNTEAICIPLMCLERKEGYWTAEQEIELVSLQRQLLSHPNVDVVGQNYLYDAQYLALYWGYLPRCYIDTMILHHVCWPGTPKGLDYLSSLYCNFHSYWKDEGKTWDEHTGEDQLWTYNCKDAVTTLEVSYALESAVEQLGLDTPAKWQMEQFPMVLGMMLRGVQIDLKRRETVTLNLAETVERYDEALAKVIPRDVYYAGPKVAPWHRSPKQQMEIFYEVLGIQKFFNRKTGSLTVDDEHLAMIAQREPILAPIIQMLQEYRSLGVFYNNFCKARLDPDNQMRCSYSIPGTETFRWSSSENAFGRGTNLQNLPKGSEKD